MKLFIDNFPDDLNHALLLEAIAEKKRLKQSKPNKKALIIRILAEWCARQQDK